ncbi:glycosyltransferase family 4 protein [Candidatus Berkelbacteria bacterium]|nr:glycosyltransferase family 4 protein [Candidatus Berkelbacteria bacterium]
MKVAVLGSILKPTLPAAGIGGISVFNYSLAAGLAMLEKPGDELSLYATGDSKVPGRLVPVVPQALVAPDQNAGLISGKEKTIENAQLAAALRGMKEQGVDVVHHSHYNFLPVVLSAALGLKTVVTVHVNRDISFIDDIKAGLGASLHQVHFVSISDTHRQVHPDIEFSTTIHNGIDLGLFRVVETPQDYVAWIGRITPYKGLLEAVEAAAKAGVGLRFAGPINDEAYFAKVQERAAQTGATYLGSVDAEGRNELLGNAKALLVPIRWDEPFGLTMVEAMATGTPVIAFRRGAVPEVVDDGVTGYIVPEGDIDAMAAKIAVVHQLDRRACRQRVEERFSAERMAKAYYQFYRDMSVRGSE